MPVPRRASRPRATPPTAASASRDRSRSEHAATSRPLRTTTHACRPDPSRCVEEADRNVSQTTTGSGDLFAQILDPANRADPYPLYAQLREPRSPCRRTAATSSAPTRDRRAAARPADQLGRAQERSGRGALAASGRLAPPGEPGSPPFIFLDPPEHDRLRRLVMRQFTPARVRGDAPARIVASSSTGCSTPRPTVVQLDVVDDFAYPLPGHGDLRAARRAARGRATLPRLGERAGPLAWIPPSASRSRRSTQPRQAALAAG